MSLDGTIKDDADMPKTMYYGACVVQQHDGKLLILGKNEISITSLKILSYFQGN